MRKIAAAVALLSSFAIVACASDTPGATAPDAEVLGRISGYDGHRFRQRRIEGPCETVLAPTIPISPGVVRQIDNGACQLSRFGKVGFLSDKVLQLALGTQTIEATFTMENGDILRAVGTGTNEPSGPGKIRFVAEIRFVGGTGRFVRASGYARSSGEADLIARRSTSTIEGYVIYDRRDRNDN